MGDRDRAELRIHAVFDNPEKTSIGTIVQGLGLGPSRVR